MFVVPPTIISLIRGYSLKVRKSALTILSEREKGEN